ncbi:hypothetical protein CDAR_297351 [Caerostris darwini]|uniref:Uncharacterized protein n=1 Tax=Caerostris darwini TaxID=1538125 RepID=A0AAV4PQY2_9ARAC|nr:hypothetical protein CDAR_297351 [Caerostris darwini]
MVKIKPFGPFLIVCRSYLTFGARTISLIFDQKRSLFCEIPPGLVEVGALCYGAEKWSTCLAFNISRERERESETKMRPHSSGLEILEFYLTDLEKLNSL